MRWPRIDNVQKKVVWKRNCIERGSVEQEMCGALLLNDLRAVKKQLAIDRITKKTTYLRL